MSDAAASGYVDPNFPNPHGPHDARIIIYGYTPNTALAILGIVLFSAAFVAHATQLLRYRLWAFSALALAACLMEVVGYVARYLSARADPYSIPYFVVEYFFVVTAPVLLSAAVYVCLSRLVGWALAAEGGGGLDAATEHEQQKQQHAWLRPRLILWAFVVCDVVTTVAQVAGAALVGAAESNRESPVVPNDILIAGLAFQTFAFSLFLCLFLKITVVFHKDIRLAPKLVDKRAFFIALATASILVYVRTIFRLVESAQGVFGYLSSHELLFGFLDFAPIVVAVWTLVIWHPGRCLPDVKHLKAGLNDPLASEEREDENMASKEDV